MKLQKVNKFKELKHQPATNMPTINNDNLLCANCTNLINVKDCKNIHRCGDAYICSQKCSIERFRELRNIDPGFNYPHIWPLVKNKSTGSLFNHEIITKNQHVNDKHKHISKTVKRQIEENQTAYFDIIHDSEEAFPFKSYEINEECENNIENNIETNTINSTTVQRGFNQLRNRYFILGLPSFCGLCILITYNV